MITIGKHLLIQNTFMLVVWDLVNLRQFDHINRMKTLSVITSSGFHCIKISTSSQFFFLVLPLAGWFWWTYIFPWKTSGSHFDWSSLIGWPIWRYFDFVQEAHSLSQNLTCLRIFHVEGFELKRLSDKKGVICHWSILFNFVQFGSQ